MTTAYDHIAQILDDAGLEGPDAKEAVEQLLAALPMLKAIAPDPIEFPTPGQIGYAVYREEYPSPNVLRTWTELSPSEQASWDAAGDAISREARRQVLRAELTSHLENIESLANMINSIGSTQHPAALELLTVQPAGQPAPPEEDAPND